MLEQRKEYIKERKKEMINGRKSVVRFSNQICFESQGKQEVVEDTEESQGIQDVVEEDNSTDKEESATCDNPDTRYQSNFLLFCSTNLNLL